MRFALLPYYRRLEGVPKFCYHDFKITQNYASDKCKFKVTLGKTLQKLFVSTKFPPQEIRWNSYFIQCNNQLVSNKVKGWISPTSNNSNTKLASLLLTLNMYLYTRYMAKTCKCLHWDHPFSMDAIFFKKKFNVYRPPDMHTCVSGGRKFCVVQINDRIHQHVV